jgi:hypothetical protein
MPVLYLPRPRPQGLKSSHGAWSHGPEGGRANPGLGAWSCGFYTKRASLIGAPQRLAPDYGIVSRILTTVVATPCFCTILYIIGCCGCVRQRLRSPDLPAQFPFYVWVLLVHHHHYTYVPNGQPRLILARIPRVITGA